MRQETSINRICQIIRGIEKRLIFLWDKYDDPTGWPPPVKSAGVKKAQEILAETYHGMMWDHKNDPHVAARCAQFHALEFAPGMPIDREAVLRWRQNFREEWPEPEETL